MGKTQVDFARKEFGKNLKLAVLHQDETTPHIHLVISTDITKVQKFKKSIWNLREKGNFVKRKAF